MLVTRSATTHDRQPQISLIWTRPDSEQVELRAFRPRKPGHLIALAVELPNLTNTVRRLGNVPICVWPTIVYPCIESSWKFQAIINTSFLKIWIHLTSYISVQPFCRRIHPEPDWILWKANKHYGRRVQNVMSQHFIYFELREYRDLQNQSWHATVPDLIWKKLIYCGELWPRNR